MTKSLLKLNDDKVMLRKELGLREGVTLILGIILGSGIFISPKAVYENTGSVWGALTVWAACGILATIGALSYAELGTALTQSGGDYHYINQSYGSLPAFLYLWDAVMVFVPSSNAIMGLTFANNVLQPIFQPTPIHPVCRQLIAAASICLLTFMNAYDIKFTTRLQNVFTFTMMAALLMIIGGGIVWICQGQVYHFHNGWSGTKASISEWSVAFFLGIFSYSGWNYLNFMVEELRDPFKNLPRAIYISVPVVTAIYLFTNIAYLAVLGPNVLKTEAIAVDFAEQALGWLSFLMPVLVAMASLGGLSVNIMTSARMCFAGARNGHMPELMALISLKCMSPMPALVFLMLLSLIMLVPDNLTSLITYCSVIESFFTILTCSSVLWLRYKRPDLNRPIKVQLWMPALFVVVNSVLLIVPIMSEPIAVISGIVITFAGVPVYYGLVIHRPKCIENAAAISIALAGNIRIDHVVCSTLNYIMDRSAFRYRNMTAHEFTTPPDEIVPMLPDEGLQQSTVIAGLMPDSFGEMFNFLDGDSFGIGPMHEFVYGWQAIVNTMSMKNNVEVRKRAGLQRFALAGINGITLISHIGVTEIMINGTRSYCFGGVSRPPGRRSVICKGAMYQEGRFSCKVPYLRYPTALGYRYCIDKYAAVNSLDGTYKKTYCARGESIPKFHYDYICERRDIKIKRINLTDPSERFNIRNPIVRRAEYYRAPYDILKSCPDWYGCNLQISPDMLHQELPAALMDANETAFVGHGGKYWLSLYYTQLSTYAIYFQSHGEYPWQSNRPITSNDKGGIWEQLLKANIGPDMNLHYNLNGIYNRYPGGSVFPDIMRNDGQVQPSNFRTENREGAAEELLVGNSHISSDPAGGEPNNSPAQFVHDSQIQGNFEHGKNLS